MMSLHRFPRSFALATMVALALASFAPDAGAQSKAQELFRQGREAAERGDWKGACARFQESLAYESSVGALVNLGECHEKQGQLVAALPHWRRGLEKMASDDGRRDLAQARIAELERRTPKLFILASAAAKVFVDGLPATIGQPMLVDPGSRKISISGDGPARTITVVAVEGELHPVDLTAPPPQAPAPPASPPVEPVEEATEEPTENQLLVPALVSYGIGGAGLVVFGVSGALYLGQKSTVDDACTDGRCSQEGLEAGDRGFSYGIVNAVGLGVAILGAGVGTTLLLVGTPSAPGGNVAARVRGSSVELSGAF